MTDKKIKSSFKKVIKPGWGIINELLNECSIFLEENEINRKTAEAVMMSVSELAENAVKYGAKLKEIKNIEFELSVKKNKISIIISNGCKSEENINSLKEHLKKIKNCGSPGVLYKRRLKELMKIDRPAVSRLGLYRIAYEGGFTLSCIYKNQKLTIKAEKLLN